MQIPVLMLAFSFLGFAVFAPVARAATAQDQILSGIDEACADSSCSTDDNTIDNTVVAVINIVSGVVGVISVIMVIIGGLKYTSSQGDSSGISSAKNTIIYAVVGLVIVVLAQVIVRFVVGRVTTLPSSDGNNPQNSQVIQRS